MGKNFVSVVSKHNKTCRKVQNLEFTLAYQSFKKQI